MKIQKCMHAQLGNKLEVRYPKDVVGKEEATGAAGLGPSTCSSRPHHERALKSGAVCPHVTLGMGPLSCACMSSAIQPLHRDLLRYETVRLHT